jgi:hypothetical protein
MMALGLAITARAQTVRNVRANIPFEFNFDGKTFPAGEYTLAQPLEHSVVLRDFQGHTLGHVFTNTVQSSRPVDATKLKFQLIDGQYVFSEIWHEQTDAGERLQQPSSQAKAAKRRATGNQPSAEGGQQ